MSKRRREKRNNRKALAAASGPSRKVLQINGLALVIMLISWSADQFWASSYRQEMNSIQHRIQVIGTENTIASLAMKSYQDEIREPTPDWEVVINHAMDWAERTGNAIQIAHHIAPDSKVLKAHHDHFSEGLARLRADAELGSFEDLQLEMLRLGAWVESIAVAAGDAAQVHYEEISQAEAISSAVFRWLFVLASFLSIFTWFRSYQDSGRSNG